VIYDGACSLQEWPLCALGTQQLVIKAEILHEEDESIQAVVSEGAWTVAVWMTNRVVSFFQHHFNYPPFHII